MACTFSYDDERLGKIEVLVRANSRRMSIRVHEGGVVRVTTSPLTSMPEIARYVKEQSEWIEKARKRMESRTTEMTIFTPETPFEILGYKLEMTPDSKDRYAHLSVKPGVMKVNYPATCTPATNSTIQNLVRKGIAFVLKREAERTIPGRLAELAEKNGLRYASLSFKDLKSRWGSCSTRGEIMINVQLVRLPQHLIDHVLLHELCHTVEMNHGPKFHKLLNKVDGGMAEKHSRELSSHRTQRW